MVAFCFCSEILGRWQGSMNEILGRWQGSMNDTLSFYVWWGHSVVVGTFKPYFL